ncbi:PREDICTED: probable LRR receptor-like serine/threonine-protein kinase At1g34110 [Tarenaya hassleriana]|uniref:probable LRR receptor-like serine/threonine-protein kinase At1g34110 n=1 Tax=Tarenaya hassleriana TaxID=28532 RepID=UPI00053C4EDC|nr:PREDICTED: probable LRR receptor-like serine/threonine-protein kinase At1g34110 [Tarenaya hassleriana]
MRYITVLLSFFVITNASAMAPSDRAGLEAIRDSLTEIPGSSSFSSWDFTVSEPCSSFSGVTCSLGRVTTLSLGPGLSGSLSPALSNLTRLTQLILLPGLVTGPVPPELGSLTFLRVISLTRNRLTGSIPVSFSALVHLHTLDLSYNELTGVIPPRLTRLPRLKVLVLAGNHLSGTLGPFSNRLFHLDLKMNRISGMLPRFFPNTLRYLSVSDNSMRGSVEVLESLTELRYLDLSMNKFTGTIPISIFGPATSSVLLQRNKFTEIGAVTPFSSSPSFAKGSVVDLSHNSLAGELSRELAGAENLFLNSNLLTGEVPVDYLDSLVNGTIKTLYLQNNYFKEFPMRPGVKLPGSVSVCLSYNCMSVPSGLSPCPHDRTPLGSRPASQCFSFSNRSSSKV